MQFKLPPPKAAPLPPVLVKPMKNPTRELPVPDVNNKQPVVPSLWRRDAAGVHLEGLGARAAGYKALDNICRENGWSWGVVGTYLRGEQHQHACTAVIVGVVIEGCSEKLGTYDKGTNAWNEIDEALGHVARQLEAHHGKKG